MPKTVKLLLVREKSNSEFKHHDFSGLLTWITILCFDQQITTVDELFTVHGVHQDKFHFRWFKL